MNTPLSMRRASNRSRGSSKHKAVKTWRKADVGPPCVHNALLKRKMKKKYIKLILKSLFYIGFVENYFWIVEPTFNCKKKL